MKTIKNLTLLMGLCAVVLLAVGCDKETEEPKNWNRAAITGQWKLIESSVSVNHSQPDITDYSKENIIFNFQENNKLVVTGHIPDILGLFDDYQEGEHFYEYRKLNVCPTCLPGPNLFIDKPELGNWERAYFCTALSDEETMGILAEKWEIESGYYRWDITFKKLD